MKKHNLPGLLVVFAGLDGSRKTTQISKIEAYLKAKAIPVKRFYEPTHGKYGQQLRDLFKVGHIIPIQEEIELSIKDRSEDLKENILPALKEGNIVLLDRYYWSNIAYQGIVDEVYSLEYILAKSEQQNFPEPDVIFFFNIIVQKAIDRISSKRKPNEYEALQELTKSKKKYDEIIEGMPQSFSGTLIQIEAEKKESEVFYEIKNKLTPIISKWDIKKSELP